MVVPASGLWIFPESSLKNSIDVLSLALPAKIQRYNFSNGQDSKPKILKPKFDLCTKVWLYYLGDLENLNKQFFNGDAEEVKMAYLLLLLDVQFGFDIEKKERIKIAENIFGLGRSESDEVKKIMDAFDYIWQGRFDKGFAIGKAEGIIIGKNKVRQRNIRYLASYLIKESGNTLTKKEATEKAKAILSGKDPDN